MQWKPSQVLAVKRQHVKGIELHLMGMLARVQRIEISNAVAGNPALSARKSHRARVGGS
jgi:hypothetical protein